MRLTPRKPEVEHVGQAIDKDHPSVDAAAKAAIKAVAEALDLRDFFTLVSPDAGMTILWGVYASEKEAEKARDTMLSTGAFGSLIVWPVMSAARILNNVEGVPQADDCECGHPVYLHQFEGSSRGRCGISVCKCGKFKKHAHPIPTHPTCMTCKQPVAA